jgi:anthranilate phosphoribosyltransferase
VKAAIAAAISGQGLSPDVLRIALSTVFEGQATAAQIGALLVALRMRGEGAEELAVAATVMREHCVGVKLAPMPVLLDTCGTGGDGRNTFNISTAAALVIAACDVPVAKHGNRAASSKVGSADVLEALGVRIDLPAEQVARCIEELGIGFMFARTHHPAMRHVAQVRAELGVRTIFNLIGPLSNPASATHQVVGVPSAELLTPFAEALARLGSRRVWVVLGHGGLDELSLAGPSEVIEVDAGEVRRFSVQPEDFGLRTQSDAGFGVESSAQSAAIIRAVLQGERGAARDVVLLNAAAGLIVAGRAASFVQATQLAADAIDSGAAVGKLSTWAALTQTGQG